MRVGMLALIRPVITSTDGRCVARIRWMPAARAFCASGDQLLDLLAGDHHQVGQFVDHHDVRHGVSGSGVSGVSESGLGSLLPAFGVLDAALLKAGEVAHAHRRHQLVALLHLGRRTSLSALAACFMSTTTGASRCGMPS